MRKVFGKIAEIWTANGLFGVTMYVLGCVVAVLTIPHVKNAHLYENLYTELFFDISILCFILWLLPKTARTWVKRLLYILLYGVAIVDVYCFWKYDTTMTPTVMMLIAETNSDEAGEFFQTVFSADVIFGKVGVIFLLVFAHATIVIVGKLLRRKLRWSKPVKELASGVIAPVLGVVLLAATIWTGCESWQNKKGVWRLMTAKNIGEVEHILTEKDHGVMYQPAYRMAFSAYANSLTAGQIKKLQKACDDIVVDSCLHTVPEIVVIFGESFSRHHSQQYGYWQPTTPRQVELEQTGRLVKFSDVICPWNLTSFMFKLMFSTYTVGDEGEWCDYPLFPELFKASGYRVTFITNQFLPKAKEAVYDFSGGFFINDPKLSEAQFDARNTKKYAFDEDLLGVYEQLKDTTSQYNLTMFHLIGQHVLYRQRCPQDRKKFHRDEYTEAKPHLKAFERQILADYDNAVLYNDSVVSEIVKKFDDKDAIVLYVPDHGEECYEGDLHFYCRMHSTAITSRLAHAEFDIPFWIYCSPQFIEEHGDIYQQVVAAKDKRYMTDALPHLLMYLAGIHSKDYHAKYNILSSEYDEHRPRIMKNTTDYDKLK